MKCIEARRMVTPFVKKELSEKDMEAFLHHIEHCSDCMDELDIYYSVYNALNLLDSGAHHEYNFRKMLEEDVRDAKRTILRHRISRIAYATLYILAEVLLLFSIYTGVRMKTGKNGDIFKRAILRLHMQERDSEFEAEAFTETSAQTEAATDSEAVTEGLLLDMTDLAETLLSETIRTNTDTTVGDAQ